MDWLRQIRFRALGLEQLWRDCRFAGRALRKSPGFTLVAVRIVAIGVGAATAMFSTVNAVVLRPISLPEPERIARVYETNLARNLPQFSVSVPNYFDWKNRSRSWESLAALGMRAMNLTGRGEPEIVQVRTVTANFLSTLGIPIARGRGFLEEEDRPGAAKVAVITTGFWERQLGGRPEAVGETLSLDGVPHAIVGVMAPEAAFPGDDVQIAVPLAVDAAASDRNDHMIEVYGRLKRGVTLEQADSEMKALAAQLWSEFPVDEGWSTILVPLEREIVGDGFRKGIYVLVGAVGILLLIACANLSNLMLVRATARTHELAVRTAIGASRWRIARQLITESLIVTFAGGVAGIALAAAAVGVMRALPLPRMTEISLDLRVLAVACAAMLLTGLLAAAGPALAASQTRPQEALKGRGTRSGHRSRLRNAMVVTQLALSLTLLVSATLLVRSFWRLLQVDPGFRSERVLTLSLRPMGNAAQFYDAVGRELAGLPDIASVGSISSLPLTPGSTQNNIFAVGPTAIPPEQTVQANWRLIHGDYFGAMQIPILRGRDFQGIDRAQARLAMVISASLAKAFWGDEDPIGRRIKRGNTEFTIIGVVGDVRSQLLGVNAVPSFYMSVHRFTAGPQVLVVRAKGELAPLVTAVRDAIRKVDPTVPIFRVRTMDDVRAASLRQERLVIALLGGFAGVALLLAALGTYGVVAFTVQQRTSEIGIRLAIGAQAADVLRLVVGGGTKMALLGVAIGLAVALAGSRVLASMLYETTATDVISYMAATVALLSAAALASLIPARRATRIDPLIALRTE